MSDVTANEAGKPLVIDCRQVTRTYSEGPEKLTIFS
ncbi:MAG TPA: lipoprotein-releasing system ATP-binding protein LolD, partial [Marinobacter sp.]|nr:lipoprotein-releasing system ATP-binding protein LolD [Marinobacter sp.]